MKGSLNVTSIFKILSAVVRPQDIAPRLNLSQRFNALGLFFALPLTFLPYED